MLTKHVCQPGKSKPQIGFFNLPGFSLLSKSLIYDFFLPLWFRAQNFDGNYFEKFTSLDRNDNQVEAQNKVRKLKRIMNHNASNSRNDIIFLSK